VPPSTAEGIERYLLGGLDNADWPNHDVRVRESRLELTLKKHEASFI